MKHIQNIALSVLTLIVCFTSYYNIYVREYQQAELQYVPGQYIVEAEGFHGPIKLAVTFDETKLTNIEVLSEEETEDIGSVALPIITKRIMDAQGLGVDVVTGATVTSRAVMAAVSKAAEQAQVSDLVAFTKNRAPRRRNTTVEDTWDIVIIGGGGAGLAAAAQAAQDGNTVLVIEKNSELGGNTVVSGGAYQSVIPYLVWDAENPDATQGKAHDGKMYDKIHCVQGCLSTLRTILNWSEKPFDTAYYRTHKFEAGNIEEQAKHGVHKDYLPVLKALKAEIRQYLAWAEKRIAAGANETELALFSTNNLHIFQTYYGGVRPSADGKEWCYGDVKLVSQFVKEGQQLKSWLTGMGVEYEETQSILVGAMWYRACNMHGATIMLDGKEQKVDGNKGTYVMAPYCAFINANKHNTLMTLTSADDLITDGGRVVGVNAHGEDGTKVKAYARKGVIIATGGYAANISKVIETNKYWDSSWVLPTTKTTNRSTLQGDGIWMAQDIGADVTGMGWTQMMPLSYAETGVIAFGPIDNCVLISPETGYRYINELSERDVLTINAYEHGIELFGARGVHFYINGAFARGENHLSLTKPADKEKCQYTTTIAGLPAIFKKLGIPTDPNKVIASIRAFDTAIMQGKTPAGADRTMVSDIIGTVKRDAHGRYMPETYDLDNAKFFFRILAPATHHTMGGLKVDLQRRVLNTDGKPIPGLFAAGEVTGGIHGGNRLGGNAITEVLVSGRIAARAASNTNTLTSAKK